MEGARRPGGYGCGGGPDVPVGRSASTTHCRRRTRRSRGYVLVWSSSLIGVRPGPLTAVATLVGLPARERRTLTVAPVVCLRPVRSGPGSASVVGVVLADAALATVTSGPDPRACPHDFCPPKEPLPL
jgi:hypothetical protein